MPKIYSNKELRFFRLVKCVVNHATEALQVVFIQEWNRLHPLSPWQNDRTSGSLLLKKERPSSRLLDRGYSTYYLHIKDNLSRGNVEDWDVTALVFALKYSHALRRMRYGSHWRRIKSAIHGIRGARNALSHASKASISQNTFEKNVDILVRAVKDLLSRSDRLVKELQTLRNETKFRTEDSRFKISRLKQFVKDDRANLLLLEGDLKRLENKIKTFIFPRVRETAEAAGENPRTSDNTEIVSRMRRRIDKIEHEVDQVPSRSKPAIFGNARYIRLINRSFFMSYNFRWGELEDFVREFDDDPVLKAFARIQSVVALSHQSRKEEALEAVNDLIPQALRLENHGVELLARIKIRKAYLLHDQGKDEEARNEADEAEKILSQGECHEDMAEVNYAKANIILSAKKNAKEYRESILLYLDKCIHSCEKATVDKSVTVLQATLRKALLHLGYYQHGILKDVPKEDVAIAETILTRVSEQSEPLSERSKVYHTYGKSLLAHRNGDTGDAAKLEHEVRKKCKKHKIGFEIKQLDMLRTLVRGGV